MHRLGAVPGTYSATVNYTGDAIYNARSGADLTLTLARQHRRRRLPNIPTNAAFGDTPFIATVSTNGDGTQLSVVIEYTECLHCGPANSLTVTYVASGNCTLTAEVAAGTELLAGLGIAADVHRGAGNPESTDDNEHPGESGLPRQLRCRRGHHR